MSAQARSAPPALRHNRDFVLLWAGQAISRLGSQASFVAFPLLVLASTGSPTKAGIVGFANGVPALLIYLPAGVLIDRHDRRRILIAASVIGALAMGSLVVALGTGTAVFAHIVIVALVEGSVVAVLAMAEQGALPNVVGAGRVSEAVARNEARSHAAALAGPPLGGVLFAVDRLAPFAADAASYLCCAVLSRRVRGPLQETRAGDEGRDVRREIAEGIRCLWRQPFVRASAIAVAVGNLVWSGLFIVLVVRATEGGASAALVGAMLAVIGAGGLVGALVAPAAARRLPAPTIVLGTFWIQALLLPALMLTRAPPAMGVIVGLGALAAPAWNAVVVGARLSLTPDRLRGRVNAAARLTSAGMMPFGALGAGLMIDGAGTTVTIGALSVVSAMLALAATASPALRRGPGH